MRSRIWRRYLLNSLALVIMFGCLVAPSARGVQAGGCAGVPIGLSACRGSGSVTVAGHDPSGDGSAGSEPGASAAPTRYSVSCDGDPAAQLAVVGDPDAKLRAQTCLNGDHCQGTGGLGGEFVDTLIVQEGADGVWTTISRSCVFSTQPQVTAALVRDRVVRLIPGAAVGLAPRGSTLVNIETVMWVRAGERETLAPIQILGRTVRVTLSLDQVAWRFGDGASDTTAGAGRAYQEHRDPCTSRQCPDYYGHTYLRPGRVQVNATASWTARFSVDGGARVRIPGTVAGPTAQARIAVRQARGVLVQPCRVSGLR